MGDTLKILVVDDDKDIVEILKYNLKNSGYSVKSANNGIEAIKKAKKFLPDVILMDVMMPEMSGIEACSEIKEINELSNTIIIFLSARNEDYTQISAYDAGADDYISKPIKPKVLLKKIFNIAAKTGTSSFNDIVKSLFEENKKLTKFHKEYLLISKEAQQNMDKLVEKETQLDIIFAEIWSKIQSVEEEMCENSIGW